jgi:hypothetical protein
MRGNRHAADRIEHLPADAGHSDRSEQAAWTSYPGKRNWLRQALRAWFALSTFANVEIRAIHA